MKITKDNYKVVPENEQHLLNALLDDANECFANPALEIYWQEFHTEYSPERCDPCPDYYHTYSIRWSGMNENINDGFTIRELDNHMCTLCRAFSQLKEIRKNES